MYRTNIAEARSTLSRSIGDALRLEPDYRELSTGENDDLKLSVMCIE